MISLSYHNAWGVCAILGSILIHLTLGNLYSFSNMVTYMVSYMHERVDSSVTYANIPWVTSITTMGQGLFMVVGGLLENRIGPRLTCLMGCLLFSAGIMLTSYTVKISLAAVTLTYGLLAGLGTAIAYATPLSCGMQWFPGHKGLTNGLIVAGFGLGSLGSTTLQTMYLNPDNLLPQDSGYFTQAAILDYVPSVFVVLGSIFLVMQIIGCLLISKPHKSGEEQSLLAEAEQSDALQQFTTTTTATTSNASSAAESDTVAVRSLKPREMLRERTFYVLWLMYLCNTIPVTYVNAMCKSYGQTFIRDDHFLGVVVSLAAISNAGSRVVWGRVMDLTSFTVATRVATSILALMLATMPLTAFMGKLGFTVWLWAIFFAFAAAYVLMPTAVEKAFGPEHCSANYGLLFTCHGVAGPVVAVGNQLLLTALGYTGCFLLVGGVAALGFCLTFLVPKRL